MSHTENMKTLNTSINNDFIIKIYPNDSAKIWEQFIQYKAHTGIFGNSLHPIM